VGRGHGNGPWVTSLSQLWYGLPWVLSACSGTSTCAAARPACP